jgi:hypothetical protein
MKARLPAPVANADTLPYWNAARERRPLIRKCGACGRRRDDPAIHALPPREEA